MSPGIINRFHLELNSDRIKNLRLFSFGKNIENYLCGTSIDKIIIITNSSNYDHQPMHCNGEISMKVINCNKSFLVRLALGHTSDVKVIYHKSDQLKTNHFCRTSIGAYFHTARESRKLVSVNQHYHTVIQIILFQFS